MDPTGFCELAARTLGGSAKLNGILLKGKDIHQTGVLIQAEGDKLPLVEIRVSEMPTGSMG